MSYIQTDYHIIVRNKTSEPTLPIDSGNAFYRYIWGILQNKKCVLYQINGTEDHIHIFCSLHPNIALSDLVRELKISTNKWLRDRQIYFTNWGEGYAALTYSEKEKSNIINYIKNQRIHHKT